MDTNQESAPDWLELNELRTIKLIDAIALSLGISPFWLHSTTNTNPSHPILKEIESEFMRRMRVSSNRAVEFDEMAALYPEQQRIGINIKIASYAAWVIDVMKWKVPSEFAALTHVRTTDKSELGKEKISSQTSTIHKLGSRVNDLGEIISEARKQVKDPNNAATVFFALRDYALEERHPFTGKVTEKGLEYTNSKNEIVTLTKESLRKRISSNKWTITSVNGN